MKPSIKLNSGLASLAGGIMLSILIYFFNPFHLEENAVKAVAIAVLMIFWWVTEALPMPVVALVPIVLHPMLGISSIEEATKAYSNPVIFLFMGGFMLGLAIEKWSLHKRIALNIVKRTGAGGNRIILGFIAATAFLSMWLSNTATTMMMFPIAASVIAVVKDHTAQTKGYRNFALSLMLVIAYASNIGGMATIIGTPPNVAFAGFIEKKYGYTIQFIDWIKLCFPLMLILLVALYFLLTGILFPNDIKHSEAAHNFIDSELDALGPMSRAEKSVLTVFICTALLWITKDLINSILPFKLDDNMIAIGGAIVLFAVPAGKDHDGKMMHLLSWPDTSRMAWGILLLFGGGIALAGSLERTGVMDKLGQSLSTYSNQPVWMLIVIVVMLSIFLSEVMSNVAQVIILAPVLASLSDSLGIDPLLLGIPMTLAASAASMLPMGTPPNAIVFGSGHISLHQMLKAGLLLNIICVLIISLFASLFLPQIMHAIR